MQEKKPLQKQKNKIANVCTDHWRFRVKKAAELYDYTVLRPFPCPVSRSASSKMVPGLAVHLLYWQCLWAAGMGAGKRQLVCIRSVGACVSMKLTFLSVSLFLLPWRKTVWYNQIKDKPLFSMLCVILIMDAGNADTCTMCSRFCILKVMNKIVHLLCANISGTERLYL